MTDNETSVTIKYKAGHDSTWAVFRGGVSQVKEQIATYFGLEPKDGETSHELVLRATDLAQGKVKPQAVAKAKAKAEPKSTEEAVANVKEGFGGDTEVVKDSDDPWAEDPEQQQAQQPAADEPDYSGLIADLGDAPDLPALKKLYVKNKGSGAMEVPEVRAAYNARGRALKAAAAT